MEETMLTLQTVIIFKCDNRLKGKLVEIAKEIGVSKSAVARNTLALALLPPENKTHLEKVVDKIREERRDQLYVREQW